MYLETSAGAAGDVSYANLPGIDLSVSAAPSLSFAYHMVGATMGTLTAEISTDQVTWDTLMTKTGQQQATQAAPYADTAISLSAYAGQVVYVRFGGSYGGSYTGDMAIDDVYIGTPVTCSAPLGLAVDQVYPESVDLSWSGDTTASYLVEYGLSGFTAGSGATVPVADSSVTISGLTSGRHMISTLTLCSPDTSSAAIVSASTLAAPTLACGNYELRLFENYGDGWNGNTMTVTSNNGAPTFLDVPSEFLAVECIVECFPRDTLTLVWDGGGLTKMSVHSNFGICQQLQQLLYSCRKQVTL